MDITSGTSTAKNCTILLVDTNKINIMGRDIMDKLGLRLTMGTQQKERERNLLNITNTHLRISKWIFQKYPHLCTRLGRSRNCGNKFLPGHLNVCPAKNEICRICKKIGHFAKQFKSEMPPLPQYNPQQRRQQNYPGQQTYSGYH